MARDDVFNNYQNSTRNIVLTANEDNVDELV
jgi:hypothetical protein